MSARVSGLSVTMRRIENKHAHCNESMGLNQITHQSKKLIKNFKLNHARFTILIWMCGAVEVYTAWGKLM